VASVSRVLAIAGAAGLLAAVAGCSLPNVSTTPATSAPASGSVSGPAATTPAAPAPTVPMTPLPRASGQLTGAQLQSVLLPQSYFPAGFTLSSSGAVNSGGSLTSAAAQYDLATVSCGTFVNHLGSTGFGETAMAADGFTGQQQGFDQFLYQFASAAEASRFVAGVKALAGRCHSFSATDDGATGTFSLSAATASPVGGHPSLELAQTGTISGSSLVLDTLFTASGADVFAASAVGLGTSAPTGLATSTIVYDLMKRQAAEAVLG
jgi:hypothetical protein